MLLLVHGEQSHEPIDGGRQRLFHLGSQEDWRSIQKWQLLPLQEDISLRHNLIKDVYSQEQSFLLVLLLHTQLHDSLDWLVPVGLPYLPFAFGHWMSVLAQFSTQIVLKDLILLLVVESSKDLLRIIRRELLGCSVYLLAQIFVVALRQILHLGMIPADHYLSKVRLLAWWCIRSQFTVWNYYLTIIFQLRPRWLLIRAEVWGYSRSLIGGSHSGCGRVFGESEHWSVLSGGEQIFYGLELSGSGSRESWKFPMLGLETEVLQLCLV